MKERKKEGGLEEKKERRKRRRNGVLLHCDGQSISISKAADRGCRAHARNINVGI